MRHFPFSLAAPLCGLVVLSTPGQAQRPSPMTPGILRVCADPDNMPMSNQAGEGAENKIAELLAATWNSRLEYVWWAAPRGTMRMLNGLYCDVMIEAPVLYDAAGVTRPYYRTGYVIVQRTDAPHQVTGLDDPALKTMRIGVHLFAADGENTPPAMAMSAHGVVGLQGFSTTYTGGQNHPSDIIQAVISDSINVAIVWGPIAGYYAKQLGANLTLTPVADDTLTNILFAYSMGMATRRRDRALRDSLQKFIDAKGTEIRSILQEFGIPLFPLPSDSAKAVGSATPPAGQSPAIGSESALADPYHSPPRDTLPRAAYEGWKQFMLQCARCHGESATGTSFAPDLTRSLRPDGPVPTREGFLQTVGDGRPEKGMPAAATLGLDLPQTEQIYLYLRGRAEGEIHAGRPAVRSDS